MSRTVHIIAKNVPGYGPPDGRCLPCSGVSGRAVTASPCLSRCDLGIRSQLKISTLACASKRAYFVCKASSSGNRRKSDFSRQNNREFPRRRNRQNEERDSFENGDESELLSSKSGSFLSTSNTPSYQPNATPEPKKNEIIELFTKIQAQLRERAANKEEKKIEAPKEQGRESDVSSLLQVLKKHPLEQVKRSKGRRDIMDKSVQNGAATNGMLHNSNSTGRDKTQASYATSFRPPSKFVRRSPVPLDNSKSDRTSSGTRKKNEPEEEPDMDSDLEFKPDMDSDLEFNSGGEDTIKSVLSWASSKARKKKPEVDILGEIDEESDMDSDLESDSEFELEHETEPIFPDADVDVYGEISEVANAYTEGGSKVEVVDEHEELSGMKFSEVVNEAYTECGSKVEAVDEHEDLSGMKLPELRALAKTRGLKKISKLKKRELIELLSKGSD